MFTAAMIAGGVLGYWLIAGPAFELPLREPGADGTSAEPRGRAAVVLDGTLVTGDGKPSAITESWPGFQGGAQRGVYTGRSKLLRSWNGSQPRELWSVKLGEGHAGPAVRNGRVYVLDYDRENSADVVRCLSLDDGRDIWRYSYPVKVKRNHGMSRTVPAVTDAHVVTLGPKCQVFCLDAMAGEKRWAIDLVGKYGTTVPPWYAGQCPLIDGDRVILAPAGDDVLLMALDIASGEVIWQSPNTLGWSMTHSSVVPMTLDGKATYVYVGSGGVAGFAAEDGALLWHTPDWKINIAAIPSPVVIDDRRIFLSGGYDAGCMMIELRRDERAQPGAPPYEVKQVFRLDAKTFGSTQQTPILYRDHLFGVRPNGEVVCLDLAGNVAWSSSTKHKFGLGPYLVADGLLFVLDDAGRLVLAEASPTGWRLLAEAEVLAGPDAWGPMALVGGRLLLRDLTVLKCLEVGFSAE